MAETSNSGHQPHPSFDGSRHARPRSGYRHPRFTTVLLAIFAFGYHSSRASPAAFDVDCGSAGQIIPPVPTDDRLDCAECDDVHTEFVAGIIDSINQVAKNINRERGALRALVCSPGETLRAPGLERCPASRRIELSMIYRSALEGDSRVAKVSPPASAR